MESNELKRNEKSEEWGCGICLTAPLDFVNPLLTCDYRVAYDQFEKRDHEKKIFLV